MWHMNVDASNYAAQNCTEEGEWLMITRMLSHSISVAAEQRIAELRMASDSIEAILAEFEPRP